MECFMGKARMREENLRRAYESLQDAAEALETGYPDACEELHWLMENVAGELAAAQRDAGVKH